MSEMEIRKNGMEIASASRGDSTFFLQSSFLLSASGFEQEISSMSKKGKENASDWTCDWIVCDGLNFARTLL